MSSTASPVDDARLHAFLGQMVGDIGAAANPLMPGNRPGVRRAPRAPGCATGTAERFVSAWQPPRGLCPPDPDSMLYQPEKAMVLADEDSPVFLAGLFESLYAMMVAEPRIREAFQTGKGVGWHEHHPCLFSGTERFFRTGYRANLVQDWLPALDGVVDKLQQGASVADIGCGHGASTIIMGQAFPNSRFVGFDYHDASITRATEAAREAGVAETVRFEVASAQEYPGAGYDLVASSMPP